MNTAINQPNSEIPESAQQAGKSKRRYRMRYEVVVRDPEDREYLRSLEQPPHIDVPTAIGLLIRTCRILGTKILADESTNHSIANGSVTVTEPQ